MAPSTGPDTIRVLVATDNHVGHMERDPIRKDDSWKTFDEIMKLAKAQEVDMVLLGGDLFHDNKPSRKSMYQVMRSIRQNCLGYKPVQLQFMSDANEIFQGAFGHVNYEDDNINVSIPVFSIHGNHDDPSGEGHFCSLDLLQVAGLVNYFGRVPEADDIKVKPIFLQKGRSKLALYGMSNVRDERMFRTFRDHKVTFFRPDQQADDFFNLMVLHQNHHAHSATNYLPENALPDWMDLIVWGHEHECLIDPVKNPETGFHVMQPGSSIATSLVPGEAVQKHVALLSITGREFTVEKLPLKTVRPFITREIVLARDERFKKLAQEKNNQSEVTKQLKKVVDEMIKEANDEWFALRAEEDINEEAEAPLPLIRLKVEYTTPDGGTFVCENPQRFSNRFVGRVANVNDVVYFHRKKQATKRNKGDIVVPDIAREDAIDLSTIKVETLVADYLAHQSLTVLPEPEFGDAVNQFVTKDDKNALDDFVQESLSTQLKDILALQKGEKDVDEGRIDKLMKNWRVEREAKFEQGQLATRKKRRYKPKPDDWDSDDMGHWTLQEEAMIEDSAAVTSQGQRAGRSASGRSARISQDVEDEDIIMGDVDQGEEEEAPPKTTARRGAAARGTKTAPAKAAATRASASRSTRGRKKGPFEDEEEDEEEEDDMFVDDVVEESPPPPPKRAAPSRAKAPKTSTAAPTRSTGSRTVSKQTRLNFSSQSQAPATQATQRKRAPARTVEISDDEISDEFESMPATRTRRR